MTVNKLQIRRGGKVIDVLAAGQTFTVLRREANLDAAMLDGTLTANIQPEGLQVGDVIDLATTTEQVEPVFKGHVEAIYGQWNGTPIDAAHVAMAWPDSVKLQTRQSSSLPSARKAARGGSTAFELSGSRIEPLIPPKGAPARFTLGRMGEATDYRSWADVADLMIPLYEKAAVIPAVGPLHDEIERIKSSTPDLTRRAEQALALVQDRIRYVALTMGQGGYVPADAQLTWSRRFGDCKAKTALLIGILRVLGIQAEPVLVNSSLGDAVADRLPMVGAFDHVIARAHLGSKDYWLDGTRAGDTALERIKVPSFGWVLPLVKNASLLHLTPPPLDIADAETRLSVDASGGIFAAAPAKAVKILRGDSAIVGNALLSAVSGAQLEEFLRDYWRKQYDFVTVKSATFSHDKASGELRMDMSGEAKLEWKDAWLYVPGSSIAYEPNFERPAGPQHDAPFAVGYPSFEKTHVEIKLPAGFASGAQQSKLPAPVHETLAGIEYDRTVSLKDGSLTLETSERAIASRFRTPRPQLPRPG